jgi:hypothetical protein
MWRWIKNLDGILRGEATRYEALQQAEFRIPVGGLAMVLFWLAILYGACMGFYAFFRPDQPAFWYWQGLSGALKVPALFFLTLLVTFPSLYVFNALIGSQLNLMTVLRLLVASLSVNLAVLSSLGPIVAFFSVCTTSYSFIVLLNVVVFAFAGLLGLMFLLQTLHRISLAQSKLQVSPSPIPSPAAEPQGGSPAEREAPVSAPGPAPRADWIPAELVEAPGPLDRLSGHVLGKHVKTVFGCWVVIFGLVGAQMSWILRPFIGAPGAPFEIFRPRGSNFFESVFMTLRGLLGL